MTPDHFGRPDPRYPADGLAAVVDELELTVDLERYPRRYLLGWDGTRDGRVVAASLVEHADGSPWLLLADLERDLAKQADAATARRLWLNSWTDTTQERTA